MINKILIQPVGLPRSGKNSWAKITGLPVVDPDSLRKILVGVPFRKESEGFIWATARLMVESLFEAGHDVVILTACNHTPFRRNEWKSPKWVQRFKIFDTPVEECRKRALANDQNYLIDVINRMNKEIHFPADNILTLEEELKIFEINGDKTVEWASYLYELESKA